MCLATTGSYYWLWYVSDISCVHLLNICISPRGESSVLRPKIMSLNKNCSQVDELGRPRIIQKNPQGLV